MSIENHVSLTGNIGNDPDVKFTQGGTTITKVSLATTNKRKDKDGNLKEEVSWHRVTFFGRLADIAGEYLRKGSKVQVVGSIRYGQYEKEGVTHYSTDIIADHMMMLSPKQEEGQRSERPQQQQPQRQAPPMDDFQDDPLNW